MIDHDSDFSSVPVIFFSRINEIDVVRLYFTVMRELIDQEAETKPIKFHVNPRMNISFPKKDNVLYVSDEHRASWVMLDVIPEVVVCFGVRSLRMFVKTRCSDIPGTKLNKADSSKLRVILVVDIDKVLFEYGICPIDLAYTETKFIFKSIPMILVRENLLAALGNMDRSKDIIPYVVGDFINGFTTKVNNYVRETTHRVKQGSFLTPFMTFVYRLPYSTHQKPIKNLIFNWMYYSGDTEDLEDALEYQEKKNPVLRLTPKMKAALFDIVKLPKIYDYIQTLHDIRGGSTLPYYELGTKYGVEIYEINYIVSVINSEPNFLIQDKTVSFLSFFSWLARERLKTKDAGSYSESNDLTKRIAA